MEDNNTGINTPILTPQVTDTVPQAGIVESTTKKKNKSIHFDISIHYCSFTWGHDISVFYR